MEKYKKIFESGVFEESSERGYVVEVQQEPKGYSLKVWEMYKDDENEWSYSSPKFQARNIKINNCSIGLVDFLLTSLKNAREVIEKLASEVKDVKGLEQAKILLKAGVNPEVIKMATGIDVTTLTLKEDKPKKPSKAKKVVETQDLDIEIPVLATFLEKLGISVEDLKATTKKGKKSKK